MEFFDTLFSGQVAHPRATLYRREDHGVVAEQWRKVFAARLHAATGEWRHGGYDWHIFTYGYADAVAGKQAIERYGKIERKDGYVFTHTVRKPLCCSARQLPSHAAIEYAVSLFPDLADLYFVDRQFQWTFVVTHEASSGIGPFFATAGSPQSATKRARRSPPSKP
jgi:Domain of unknown function (DUF4275)